MKKNSKNLYENAGVVLTRLYGNEDHQHAFSRCGVANGYIGVFAGHPWFGCNYNELEREGVTAHGGLTYSRLEMPAFDGGCDTWWIGFDTRHWGDTPEVQNWSYVGQEVMRLKQQALDAYKADIESHFEHEDEDECKPPSGEVMALFNCYKGRPTNMDELEARLVGQSLWDHHDGVPKFINRADVVITQFDRGLTDARLAANKIRNPINKIVYRTAPMGDDIADGSWLHATCSYGDVGYLIAIKLFDVAPPKN